MPTQGEYARLGGVDYTLLQGFKDMMVAVGKATRAFPNTRDVYMEELWHSHGGVWTYTGTNPHSWVKTHEGLGNKNWIAEWMYKFGDHETHHEGIAIDNALMAVNDVIAQGAMPVEYGDEVAGGDSEWFADQRRNADLARGTYKVCEMAGMALGEGESPALKYLINATPPVTSAPVFSGSVIGLIAPKRRMITGEKLGARDHILVAESSGIHSNGVSLVIGRALQLPDQFMTKLPNGNTLGAEALIPTTCYVGLVEALLENEVEVHALLPGTGDGPAKLSFDKRHFTYRIHSWFTDIPPLFLYMKELGVSIRDLLTTFNWGGGYYVFVPEHEVDRAIAISTKAGYKMLDVGIVEEGERQTIFGPENNLILPPPGE